MTIEVFAVPAIPEVRPGDDLGRLIVDALVVAETALEPGDLLVVASKVLAKALGLRRYASRDSVIAAETVRVVAERSTGDRVTRVVEAAAGPVMAAAGVDESNLGDGGGVLPLPRDPDGAAADLLASVRRGLGWQPDDPLGVIVSDTAGRPWRSGVIDFALGSAGVQVLDDHRGRRDADGRPLSVTTIAVADEVAAAADLVKGKATSCPVAVVRGLPWATIDRAAPGAASLVRTGPTDWFRTGHVEAVRAALGVDPGTPQSAAIGIPALGAEDPMVRAARTLRLALHPLPGVSGDITHPRGGVNATVACSDPYLLGQAAGRIPIAAASEQLRVTEVRRESGSVTFLLEDVPDPR